MGCICGLVTAAGLMSRKIVLQSLSKLDGQNISLEEMPMKKPCPCKGSPSAAPSLELQPRWYHESTKQRKRKTSNLERTKVMIGVALMEGPHALKLLNSPQGHQWLRVPLF